MVNTHHQKTYAGSMSAYVVSNTPPPPSFMREYYRMLNAYYQQNGLYEFIRAELRSLPTRNYSQEALRSPAYRCVEFYSSKMWPGTLPDALPVITSNANILEPIQSIWKWSNFNSKKQQWARWFSIYGDLFAKVNTKPGSVYFTLLMPEHVTDFELDERGYLTLIRIDIPDGQLMHTEVWDKSLQTVRIWRHKLGYDIELSKLGAPDSEMSFAQTHGEDFIPIVYQPFKEDGLGRGSGAFSHVLDKIDHANTSATRLSQILFRHNRPVWAALGGKDASGRPTPPPRLEGTGEGGAFSLGDNEILSLSGAADIKALVPNLNYGDALAVLQDDVREIENDLPELAYYRLREMNTISGRAALFLLDDTSSRLVEAQGNSDAALIRINQMCLTIGQNMGLFTNIGSYDNGDLDHTFAARPLLEAEAEAEQIVDKLLEE
jgi:hypothetical protein